MRSAIALAVAVLLVVGSGSAVGQGVADDGRIADVSYAGEEVASESGNETVLWLSSPHRFAVRLESTDGLANATVCATLVDAAGDEPLGCNSTSVPAETPREVRVSVSDWPSNRSGEQAVRFRLSTPNRSGQVVDEAGLSVTVLAKDGDVDGDGLSNRREVALGADLRAVDTDGDGLDDGPEVHAYGSSPTSADTDTDGLTDGAEVRTHRTDPTEADSDDDGLQDAREVEVGTNPNREDSDGDGLRDGAEVHTYETDPTDADTDDDGLDDGSEIEDENTNPSRPDTDGDGLSDNLEVATYGTDPTEVDTDDDGLEDGHEVHEYQTDPTVADTDGDGLDDGTEVNRHETDPTSADSDGDGLDDGAEVDRYGTDPTGVDSDGDGTLDPQEVDDGNRLSLPLLVGVGSVTVVGLAAILYLVVWRRRLGRKAPWRGRSGAGGGTDSADGPAGNESPRALPNRERVLALLEAHDGQIQQSDIVAETDWSKSTVSRVLAEMEDDGEIAKISLGRENLVTRPEDRPAGSRSAVDE